MNITKICGHTIVLFLLTTLIYYAKAQKLSYTKVYIKTDTSFNHQSQPNLDSTFILLKSNCAFEFKWKPLFGQYAGQQILTDGTWLEKGDSIILHSHYQKDKRRLFEVHKPELGESEIVVNIQTYDSLIGFFALNKIAVLKNLKYTSDYEELIFHDKALPEKMGIATFKLPYIYVMTFCTEGGCIKELHPKLKTSNYFLLQLNCSTNLDYQYFSDLAALQNEDILVIGQGMNAITFK